MDQLDRRNGNLGKPIVRPLSQRSFFVVYFTEMYNQKTMNQDLSELVAYLDKKFQETATKSDLNDLAAKMVTNSEFQTFKIEVKQELSSLHDEVRLLTNSIDRLVKSIETLTEEYSAISVRIDRHERWLQQVADKVGIKLDY